MAFNCLNRHFYSRYKRVTTVYDISNTSLVADRYMIVMDVCS